MAIQPNAVKPCTVSMRTVRQRFWPQVQLPADLTQCFLWLGDTNGSGYGRFFVGKRREVVHKLMWTWANGPVPDGQCVLHNCPGGDNKLCCNPLHLWLGTKGANNADRDRKGRHVALKGEQHGRAKITRAQVDEIRQTYAKGGTSHLKLGRTYGLSASTIGDIVRHKIWK